MSSPRYDNEIMEDSRFMSNMISLHYYASKIKVPTAYIIVKKNDVNDEESSKFSFVDGIQYTKDLLLSGISLVKVYKDAYSQNGRLSFDLCISLFIEILDAMAIIDEYLNKGSNIEEVLEFMKNKDPKSDYYNLIIYRYLKSKLTNKIKKDLKIAQEIDEKYFKDYDVLLSFMSEYENTYGLLKNGNIKKTNYERYSEDSIVDIIANFEKLYSNRKINMKSRYANMGDVLNSRKSFQDFYLKYRKEDEIRIKDINKHRLALMDIEENEEDPVIISNFIEQNSIVVIAPKIESEFENFIPSGIDGLDIFNDAIATKYVPYIQYNNENGQRYYKLLSGNINFDNLGLSPRNIQASSPNTIYAILWLDDPFNVSTDKDDDILDWKSILNSPSNSFYSIIYQLDDGFLEISVPNATRSNHVTDHLEIINRFRVSFPKLNIDDVQDVKMKGYFDVLGVEVDEATFLHSLIVDPLFYRHMYAEEKLRPFPFKHRLDIHYNGLYSYMGEQIKVVTNEEPTRLPFEHKSIAFSVHLRQLTEKEAEILNISTQSAARFAINGGARPDMIDEAIKTIKVLFQHYKTLHKKYLSIYNHFLNNKDRENLNVRHYTRTTEIFKGEEGKEVELSKPKQRVKELREKDPELFVKDYAGICQNIGQPVIIEKEDIENWKSQIFEHKGKMLNRQVMSFPPENIKWHFGCPNKTRPFPGVRKNTVLSNRDKYPVVPCCYSVDHISEGSTSLYNEIYRKKNRKETFLNPKNPVVTNKIIKPGQTGELPKSIVTLLSKYRDGVNLPGKKSDWKITRAGVQQSPNSVIHAILTAIMDKDYADSKNINELKREDRVKYHREEMAKKLQMSLMKQEMYDSDEKEIKEELLNTNFYLEPEKYIRAFEEYFNINIFMFTLVGTDDVAIVVPRHKSFYIKVKRSDRPTVLLLKNYGSPSDSVEYPHTELIIDINTEISKPFTLPVVSLFGVGMLSICSNLFEKTSGNVTWFQHRSTPVSLNITALPVYPHFNFYNSIEIISLLGVGKLKGLINKTNLIGQYIDPMGKARAFIVKYFFQTKNNEKKRFIRATFIIPPTTPENTESVSSNQLTTININTLQKLMRESTPTSRFVNIEGNTLGIWYQFFDLEEGIYVPIIPTNDLPKIFSDLKHGPPNPIDRHSTRKTALAERYNKLKKIIEMFFEIMEWLFEIYREEFGNDYIQEHGPDDFFNRVFVVENYKEEIDSLNFYNFDNLKRIWPEVENLEYALEYINLTVKPTNKNNKIILYSQNFEKGVKDRINEYINRTYNIQSYIKPTIESYYRYPDNFTNRKMNIVIIGPDNLRKWLSINQEKGSNEFIIINKLDMSISNNLDPIIYQDSDKNFWIVQNSFSGSINTALAIAKNWYVGGVNTGSKTKALSGDTVPSYFIYVISSGQKLVAVEDHTEPNDEIFFHIIKYNKDMYGALLPFSGDIDD